MSFAFAIVFASPWIAGIAWIASRAGRRALEPENGIEFPSQASVLRAFGGSR